MKMLATHWKEELQSSFSAHAKVENDDEDDEPE